MLAAVALLHHVCAWILYSGKMFWLSCNILCINTVYLQLLRQHWIFADPTTWVGYRRSQIQLSTSNSKPLLGQQHHRNSEDFVEEQDIVASAQIVLGSPRPSFSNYKMANCDYLWIILAYSERDNFQHFPSCSFPLWFPKRHGVIIPSLLVVGTKNLTYTLQKDQLS